MRPELLRPSAIKQKRRSRSLRQLLFIFLGLVLIFIGLGALSHLPSLTITDIHVSDTKVLDKQELQNKTLEYLSGNKAFFYSRGNIFLFSKTELGLYLQESFPRIYAVSSIERNKNTLKIEIEERAPAYTWCGNSAPVFADRFKEKECFFLDQSGFIFDKAPFFTDGVYLTIYGGLSEGSEPIGETLTLASDMSSVHEFIKKTSDIGFKINSLVLLDEGQREFLLDLYTVNQDFAKVLFNKDNTLPDILDKLTTILSEEEFKKDLKLRSDKLLYIDTRFKDKVFYKFQTS